MLVVIKTNDGGHETHKSIEWPLLFVVDLDYL